MTTPDMRTQAVLALESILMRPDAGEILAAFNGLVPSWLADQCRAATRDASDLLQRAAETLDNQVRAGNPGDIPGWARLGLLTAWCEWVADSASTCMHSPNPRSPQPVIAAAWKPGLIACPGCTHLLALPRGGVADRTCDGCGRVVAGADAGDPIYPTNVAFGELIWMAGTCTDCQFAEPSDRVARPA